eukprot:GFUD01123051.1.p1 GENE.GFUD01123051.1~~GFUD01123051.1.p1  ORF type:complete len:331 (+),score=105.97 GFUD01123051.1:54-1046(+)
MAAKTKITSFFHPVTQTQPSLTENDENSSDQSNSAISKAPTKVTPAKRRNEDDSCSPKKRFNATSPDTKTTTSIPLSPEQKARCDTSREKAKLVLLCKEMPVLTGNIGSSWFAALSDQFGQEWFNRLSRFVTKEREGHTVYPDQGEVWEWTTRTDITQTRVVILGQDPYHGPGQAHGLCFSVRPGVAPPPSLVNIYKELETDIAGFQRPSHGCLAGWADQGVLLLNSCLTVRRGEANSHKDRGWEKLTDAVISWISRNLSGVVFLLWGSHAQKKAKVVDRSKHHLLKSVHPSPLSAYRGFLGCGHFSQCNQLLRQQGRQPVDWARLPGEL